MSNYFPLKTQNPPKLDYSCDIESMLENLDLRTDGVWVRTPKLAYFDVFQT